MYEVDEKDRVVDLEGAPQSSVGAPLPLIFANEDRVILAYYMEVHKPHWDGTAVRVVDQETGSEPIAVVRIECSAHLFGPPNDEAFSGHPLAVRGLHPYGAFRIENSSWIRGLERRSRVHEYHRPERFDVLQHLVFTFHDSICECVCNRFDVRMDYGAMFGVTGSMLSLLIEPWDK